MFAVVENQQQVPTTNFLCERVDERRIGLLVYAERGGDQTRDDVGLSGGRQLNKPRAVGILAYHLLCHVQGKPRLADPASSRKCEESRRAKQLAHAFGFFDAPNEPRELNRQFRCHLLINTSTSSLDKCRALVVAEVERGRQLVNRVCVGAAARTALEVRDAADAQACSFRQRFLGESRSPAVAPEELTEKLRLHLWKFYAVCLRRPLADQTP